MTYAIPSELPKPAQRAMKRSALQKPEVIIISSDEEEDVYTPPKPKSGTVKRRATQQTATTPAPSKPTRARVKQVVARLRKDKK